MQAAVTVRRAAVRLVGARRLHVVGVVQIDVSADPFDNVRRAAALVDDAADRGAELIVLPECFAGKYGIRHFAEWAEPVRPERYSAIATPLGIGAAAMMADRAERHGVFVAGGVIESAAEPSTGRRVLFNSIACYGPKGLHALYRKIHLSRVMGITSESDVLSAGHDPVTFAFEDMRVGMTCCFDLRFRELLAQYSAGGAYGPCDIVLAPSAFLHATGVDHWELLLRRSALDGQHYVLAPNVAFCDEDMVPLFGRSAIIDPWGNILAQCDSKGDGVITAAVDCARIAEVRERLPLAKLARSFTPMWRTHAQRNGP
jgi:predicted amidohydrolase